MEPVANKQMNTATIESNNVRLLAALERLAHPMASEDDMDHAQALIAEMKAEALKILPVDSGGSHRTASITGLSVAQITERIGFAPNIEDDPYKVENSWGFTVNGVHCGVWDYKGSHKCSVPSFSAFGPIESLRLVFGGAVS
jgi:hypothetical protein